MDISNLSKLAGFDKGEIKELFKESNGIDR